MAKLLPGQRVRLTVEAVRRRIRRGRSQTGVFVRYQHSQDGKRYLVVRPDGIATAYDYHPSFWEAAETIAVYRARVHAHALKCTRK